MFQSWLPLASVMIKKTCGKSDCLANICLSSSQSVRVWKLRALHTTGTMESGGKRALIGTDASYDN